MLVCLGGADPRHQTQHVAAALLALPVVEQVHVVLFNATDAFDDALLVQLRELVALKAKVEQKNF